MTMWELLHTFHRGLGHTLSLLGLLIVLFSTYLAWKDEEGNRFFSIFFTSVVGLVDLQVLLGFILYSQLNFPSPGHFVLAILAVISLHAGNKMSSWKRAGSFLLAFVCIVGAVVLAV